MAHMQCTKHAGMSRQMSQRLITPHSVLFKSGPLVTNRQQRVVLVRAQPEVSDDELEQRLAKIRLAKGATPDGQGAKERKRKEGQPEKPKPAANNKPVYDYTQETLYYEGPPHRGDLALNLALGTTLVWLPLTVGAVGRAAFVRYRFSDRRLSVQTTAPWKVEQTDVAYQEVADVVTVSRGFGLWGDMVVTMRNGDKVEMRSLDRFKELKEYILARRDALGGGPSKTSSTGSVPSMMDLDLDDDVALSGVAGKQKPKGFST